MSGKITKEARPESLATPLDSGVSVENTPHDRFSIVGIGASAGGLEAFEQFFQACPAETGMAYVLVSHLDPNRQSLLAEILQRSTLMPVLEAVDQTSVARNHVYIIPPNREMSILNGILQLSEPEQAQGLRMPIDAFMRALADDQDEYAIGIVLSGTATDGTLGLRAILGAGGVCMVQEPSTAKYDGMPSSAISAGYATHILPVAKMPAALQELTRQTIYRQRVPRLATESCATHINQILLQIRNRTGHDFSLYKKTTIYRRIERRMLQHGIDEMAVYTRFLKAHPAEIEILFKELLINVTSFFRNPEAFATLKTVILPLLLADKPDNHEFRVWVVACSSGEEAYSIAILLREYLDETGKKITVKIYATDLDDEVIAEARRAHYPPNIAQDITPERLEQFFTRQDGGYKVNKVIREMVVFAVQSVIKDPPFTRIDLLSCRNLLIYLEPEQQERLIPTLHYALKPGGVLFLSNSESITTHPTLFSVLNGQWKFYHACHTKRTSEPSTVTVSGISSDASTAPPVPLMPGKAGTNNISEQSNRLLLKSYAPASVTTDAKGNILFVHGDISRYLSPPPGPVTNNVAEMARDYLQTDLRKILLNGLNQSDPVINRKVLVKSQYGNVTVSFSVRRLPAKPHSEACLLFSFQEVSESTKGHKTQRHSSIDKLRYEQLERELAYARDNLENTIEEQQTTNEELKSSNEEAQSFNEELQSSNEELETSKEELQSLNEELIVINTELNAKVLQLTSIQSDLNSLLNNISTGILFLDPELTIRRYSREILAAYPLIPSDVGRSLRDIKSNLEEDDLLLKLTTVLATRTPYEGEVRTSDGHWYLACITPYLTEDNVIDGVVLTFTNVTDFKLASETIKHQEALLKTAQKIAHLGSWELNLITKLASWSSEMFDIFGVPLSDNSVPFQEFLKIIAPEDQQRVANTLKAAVDTGAPYDAEYRIILPNGSIKYVRARAFPVFDAQQRVTHMAGATLDITESRKAEQLKLDIVKMALEVSEGVINTVGEPLIVLDSQLQVVSANRSFYRTFQTSAEQTVGQKLHELGNGQWDIPALRQLIEKILPDDQALDGFVVEHEFPVIGRCRMVLNARRLITTLGNSELLLLAMVEMQPLETP
ncbi:MAG: CheR family methyltransferase [Betaproteobacteria bacterium]